MLSGIYLKDTPIKTLLFQTRYLKIKTCNPENTTNKGRIDLSAFIGDKIYIIEFKLSDKPSDDPLKQIKEKKYYEKYLSENKEVYIVGIEFSDTDKNIVGFGWERIK